MAAWALQASSGAMPDAGVHAGWAEAAAAAAWPEAGGAQHYDYGGAVAGALPAAFRAKAGQSQGPLHVGRVVPPQSGFPAGYYDEDAAAPSSSSTAQPRLPVPRQPGPVGPTVVPPPPPPRAVPLGLLTMGGAAGVQDAANCAGMLDMQAWGPGVGPASPGSPTWPVENSPTWPVDGGASPTWPADGGVGPGAMLGYAIQHQQHQQWFAGRAGHAAEPPPAAARHPIPVPPAPSFSSTLPPNIRPTQSQADMEAQAMEKEKRMVGVLKRYFGDKSTGYGFIECEEAKQRFGYDVYIHARQMHRCEVGDAVSFSIVRNVKGEPQARNVCRLEDEDKFLAKKEKEVERQQSALQQKRSMSYMPAPAGSGLMDEEQAKRFQKSLKR